VLLEYARMANVYLDVLADDELDLPERLPVTQKSAGIKKKNINSESKKSAKSQ
jgi:hypothetical protein